MDSLEQKIKEYVSSVEIPDRVKPEEIRKLLEDNGDMTAGVFLRKLKELKISGSDFLELLGNSKIGNMEELRKTRISNSMSFYRYWITRC